jgi:hypothetical protein
MGVGISKWVWHSRMVCICKIFFAFTNGFCISEWGKAMRMGKALGNACERIWVAPNHREPELGAGSTATSDQGAKSGAFRVWRVLNPLGGVSQCSTHSLMPSPFANADPYSLTQKPIR